MRLNSQSPFLATFLLFLMLTTLNADQNLVVPLLVSLRNEGLIPGDESTWYIYAGLLGTVPAISGIITTLIWGYIADKTSRRRLLVIATLVGAIPTFLTAFSNDYWQLLFLRSLTGIGISGSGPVSRAFVADIYPPNQRGKGYSLISAATGGGTLIGMILAGVMPDWRSPFIIASIPNLILAPLFLAIIKDVKIGYAEPELKQIYVKGKEYSYRINLGEFYSYLKSTRTVLFMFLQGMPGTVPWGSIPYWSLTYLNVRWGISKDLGVLVLLCGGIGMIIGFFVGGMLSDYYVSRNRRNARIWISFIGILSGMLVLLYLLVYPYPVGYYGFLDILPLALIALFGLFFASLASANVPAILSEVSLPEHRGTLNSIFNVTDSIGSAFGPTITALFMSIYSFSNTSNSDSMFLGLLTAVLFWIPCAIFWLPASKFYTKEADKIRSILSERVRNT
ncbi:MAG TPA: MFS transporter [Geobacterales bacterium]|nr:MFS transporter [Geobacterales bacterium]